MELKLVESGLSGDPVCLTGYHRFLGIESRDIRDIADCIKRYRAGQ